MVGLSAFIGRQLNLRASEIFHRSRPPCSIASSIQSYLEEMEVPRRFIEEMIDTPSSKVRLLDTSELNSIQEVPSITE
jgi:hypothetical protein